MLTSTYRPVDLRAEDKYTVDLRAEDRYTVNLRAQDRYIVDLMVLPMITLSCNCLPYLL